MGTGEKKAGCKVDFTPNALKDLAALDPPNRQRIFDRLSWMAQNHDRMKHEGLKHLPSELKGLKKRREGDYRILYFYYPKKKVIRIYGVSHRSIVYRQLIKK